MSSHAVEATPNYNPNPSTPPLVQDQRDKTQQETQIEPYNQHTNYTIKLQLKRIGPFEKEKNGNPMLPAEPTIVVSRRMQIYTILHV